MLFVVGVRGLRKKLISGRPLFNPVGDLVI